MLGIWRKEISTNFAVDIAGISLKNPVIASSGVFGYGDDYGSLIDLNKFGAIIVKGVSLRPREGNPFPRICETPCGMLNAIGLQNIGIEAFIGEKLPYLRGLDVPVIVNIFGEDISEFERLAGMLDEAGGAAGIELNISCPNVKKGGVEFGKDPRMVYELVSSVRKVTRLPLIPKLSPNVTDIVEIAKAAKDGGADGLSMINTILGMAIDIDTRRPRLSNITGGLSGPAIKPVALRMVWEVSKSIDIPIIGIGGICSHEDAIEFFLAGATAVAVGTAHFIDPRIMIAIIRGLAGYMTRHKIEDVRDLIGGLKVS
ncbi:MAG: dihydroorotate dehydrogenase [Nitrospirota bacterium]